MEHPEAGIFKADAQLLNTPAQGKVMEDNFSGWHFREKGESRATVGKPAEVIIRIDQSGRCKIALQFNKESWTADLLKEKEIGMVKEDQLADTCFPDFRHGVGEKEAAVFKAVADKEILQVPGTDGQ